ncbi:TasA family protein [Nocardioides ochotonae]|uniref:TasA family protein n=1 Tax=Nocardioides ochotonae TaxID=2685869 RepID=UPI00140DC963|nr:TasA family protein [Nocardioides ochotonae]
MSTTTRPGRRRTATKVFASLALLAGAASVAGLGTFGAFTDTTTADQKVSTGTIDLGDLKGSISEPVSGLVPGDWIERRVTLTRAANSERFGSLTLTTSVSEVKGAVTDPTNGPLLAVDACSVPWVDQDGTAELTCGGETTGVVSSRSALGRFDLKDALPALNDHATAHLRITLKLAETAGNEYKNASAKVRFTFDAGQLGGKPL